MQRRSLGSTGLSVSALGFGAGHIGGENQSDRDVERLLRGAVELGVTLFDTAPSYGLSEERIGRHLAPVRDTLVLSTKCGYGAPGVADWTGACIRQNVEQSLRRLGTDRLDLLLLHSCPEPVLLRDDILRAMDDAVAAGKVRVAGYSGDNEALLAAVQSGRFGAAECSHNLCDQRALGGAIPEAAARGAGVLAKRPLANAPWRFAERPRGHYAETYWHRLRDLDFDRRGLDWDELALRFSAFSPGVSSCLVGTSRLEHLTRAAAILERGPLAPEHQAELRARFAERGQGLGGEV